jgi:muconolactone D-isomerase
MEYLIDMVTTVPQGTSSLKVDELRAAEAVRAADLSRRPSAPALAPAAWPT